MNINELQTRLDAYLALREALGFATRAIRRLFKTLWRISHSTATATRFVPTSRWTGPAARLPPVAPPDTTRV